MRANERFTWFSLFVGVTASLQLTHNGYLLHLSEEMLLKELKYAMGELKNVMALTFSQGKMQVRWRLRLLASYLQVMYIFGLHGCLCKSMENPKT